MAEINVTELSNAELRKKLTEFGKSVGPITKSTRVTLENKLKKLINESEQSISNSSNHKKKVVRKSNISSRRSSLSRSDSSNLKFAPFSSDEEDEVLFKLKKSKNSEKLLDLEKPKLVNKNEPIEAKVQIPSTYTSASPNSQNIMSKSSQLIGTKYISSNDYQSSCDLNRKNVALNAEYSDDEHFLEKLNEEKRQNIIRLSKKQIMSPSMENNVFRTPGSPVVVSRTSMNTIDKNIRGEVDACKAEVRNSFTSKKPSPPTVSRRVQLSSYNNYNTKNKVEGFKDREGNKNEHSEKHFFFIKCLKSMFSGKQLKCIACILLFGLSAVLVGLYWYNEEDPLKLTYLKGSQGKEKDINIFIECLYKDLITRKGMVECGYSSGPDYLRQEDFPQLAEGCLKNQRDIQFNVIADDTWEEVKKSYTDFFRFNESMVTSIGSYKPFLCRVGQALSAVLFRIFITFISIVFGMAIYFYMKRKWSAEDKETRQVLYFVHRIVEVVRKHDTQCLNSKEISPYLPIPHVRDMLIPLEKRKEMAKTWQKAVEFLSSSDSRIRVETQRISGEDFEVWRWIGVRTPGIKEKKVNSNFHLNSDQDKCWQGPAFDQIEKVIRLPIITPAPCLKIRCMHEGPDEREEDWVKKVEDAVLEKCENDGARILHIHVDINSKEGCVYVKCDSLESARKAFRSMYGNWFDGRLVIVKFVTLARYHQRFPDALKCVQALSPSGSNTLVNSNKDI
ncbi:uncharacterized protein LOC100215426 isoform X2 [Hydra vulgaris]|uniref:Uncharacterized protein LOC100215426 isoform X2 n=1 Tax=Hydra vulgaris TaxID=6087 RepID=A0ABM4D5H8_HYDVU